MKNLIPDKFVHKVNWWQLLSFVGILMWSSLALAIDCSAVTEISPDECNALVALYNSTNGPNWVDNQTNNWNKTDTPCRWVEEGGVRVSASMLASFAISQAMIASISLSRSVWFS